MFEFLPPFLIQRLPGAFARPPGLACEQPPPANCRYCRRPRGHM